MKVKDLIPMEIDFQKTLKKKRPICYTCSERGEEIGRRKKHF